MKKLVLPIVFFILTSCYYDSEEALYGTPGSAVCDTTVTNFSTVIQPILSTNCWMCHSNSAANSNGAGIMLQNYADVKTWVLNGKLMGDIQQLSGFNQMPKGGTKLSDCDILKIKTWISKGALNN